MCKRELFVFSGQSNMMGACVYPAKNQITFKRSFEYLHKNKRLGSKLGNFKSTAFPVGEFSYKDLSLAYSKDLCVNGKSLLADYKENTFFCPSMCNLEDEKTKTAKPFSAYSETNAPFGSSLAPFVVKEWEKLGKNCAYAHIAKGNTSIKYYFNESMIEQVNRLIEKYNLDNQQKLDVQAVEDNAGDYFFEKVDDFFADSRQVFAEEDLSEKCFFWLQGESDPNMSKDLYKIYLSVLWENLKKHGFTKFFCFRVGYWLNDNIINIINAQEEFCAETNGAYMLTRACSFMPILGQDLKKWYGKNNVKKYCYCRDSYYGFSNNHINEKGFKILAKSATKNLKRILIKNKPVKLEKEKVCL